MLALRRTALAILFVAQSASAEVVGSKAVILKGTSLLDQCSRPSPPAADGVWDPTEADVRKLEALLPAALAQAPRGRDFDPARVLGQSLRQYAGIMRGNRRYLYGSFLDADVPDRFDWRTQPLVVCDGGSSFFGVEMDVETGTIVYLEFNGPA